MISGNSRELFVRPKFSSRFPSSASPSSFVLREFLGSPSSTAFPVRANCFSQILDWPSSCTFVAANGPSCPVGYSICVLPRICGLLLRARCQAPSCMEIFAQPCPTICAQPKMVNSKFTYILNHLILNLLLKRALLLLFDFVGHNSILVFPFDPPLQVFFHLHSVQVILLQFFFMSLHCLDKCGFSKWVLILEYAFIFFWLLRIDKK